MPLDQSAAFLSLFTAQTIIISAVPTSSTGSHTGRVVFMANGIDHFSNATKPN
jgi:hypothetical protein